MVCLRHDLKFIAKRFLTSSLFTLTYSLKINAAPETQGRQTLTRYHLASQRCAASKRCNGRHPKPPTCRRPSSKTMFLRFPRAPSHLPGLSDRQTAAYSSLLRLFADIFPIIPTNAKVCQQQFGKIRDRRRFGLAMEQKAIYNWVIAELIREDKLLFTLHIPNFLSLRTSPQTGVAIPRLSGTR